MKNERAAEFNDEPDRRSFLEYALAILMTTGARQARGPLQQKNRPLTGPHRRGLRCASFRGSRQSVSKLPKWRSME